MHEWCRSHNLFINKELIWNDLIPLSVQIDEYTFIKCSVKSPMIYLKGETFSSWGSNKSVSSNIIQWKNVHIFVWHFLYIFYWNHGFWWDILNQMFTCYKDCKFPFIDECVQMTCYILIHFKPVIFFVRMFILLVDGNSMNVESDDIMWLSYFMNIAQLQIFWLVATNTNHIHWWIYSSFSVTKMEQFL